MKKRKFLMMVVCGVLVVGLLTGCGKNSKDNKPNDNSSNSNLENSVAKEKIKVSKVYAYNDNYLVVKGEDKKFYIVNDTMKVVGTLSAELDKLDKNNDDISISNDGYVYVEKDNFSTIYDKNGKVVFENDDTTKYQDLSNFSYTLRKKTSNDINNGKNTTCEIIDMDGKVIQKTNCDNKYIGGHIWGEPRTYKYFSDVNGKEFTLEGNINTIESFEDAGEYIYKYNGNYSIISPEGEIINVDNNDGNYGPKLINDEYFYNGNDKSIYKFDGTKVKTIDMGNGIDKITYSKKEKKYYVISSTGYAYIMDSNFNTTNEPIDITHGNLYVHAITPNYIVVYTSGEGNKVHYTLYDYEGKSIKEIDTYKQYIRERTNFIEIEYSGTYTYYDIKDFNELVIYK